MPAHQFNFMHMWSQADGVSHFVAVLLFTMSIIVWYMIVTKVWQHWRTRCADETIDAFWSATSLEDGIVVLSTYAPASPLTALAAKSRQAREHFEKQTGIGKDLERSEFFTRTLRQSIAKSTARLEEGLTALASIGSTAPFVGLFGTVWGIYNALVGMGAAASTGLQQVTGPVGEALIMTALGLAVAIPAVLGYNACLRVNRVTLSNLDAFAHDLHAYLTTGARIHPTTNVTQMPRVVGAA